MPLIVLSHGTGGATIQLSWLAEHLASNGYVVAAVEHHGNSAAAPPYRPQGFMLWWERAQDISYVIGKLLEDGEFGKRIDRSRIGVAGFSLGGYTALAIAGAITNRSQWENWCADKPEDPNCALPPEANFEITEFDTMIATDAATQDSLKRSGQSFMDERVRAIYAIAPVLVPALDRGSLARISIPVRLVVGRADDKAVPEDNARILDVLIPGSRLRLLDGVGHYSFLAPCTERGAQLLPQLCRETGELRRRQIHEIVGADALVFFDEALSATLD